MRKLGFTASALLFLLLAFAVLLQHLYNNRLRDSLRSSVAALGHVEDRLASLEVNYSRVQTAVGQLRQDLGAAIAEQIAMHDAQAKLAADMKSIAELLSVLHGTQHAAVSPSEPPPRSTTQPIAPPEQDHEALAKLIETDIVLRSAFPFREFSELPEEVQAEFEDWNGRALFIDCPPNVWGEAKIGRVAVTIDDQFGPRRALLSAENAADMQQLAELSYEIEAKIEAILAEERAAGAGMRFESRAAAKDFMRTIISENTRPYLRVDPASGAAWVLPPEPVLDNHELKRLYAQRDVVGDRLLRGSAGSYGVRWKGY